MATFIIRSYYCCRDSISNIDDLRDILLASISVILPEIKTLEDAEPILISYIFNFENGILYPSDIPQGLENTTFSPWSLENLFTSSLFYERGIFIKTRRLFPSARVIQEEILTDWDKTISDLEAAGVVKTITTKSWFSDNVKKFYFVDGEKEEDAIDVDFLGTKLSDMDGTTEKVLEAWKIIR